MARKSYIIGFVALCAVVGGCIYFMLNQGVKVVASSTIFKDQDWQVSLSHEVEKNSVEKGNIYVLNADNKKVAVPIKVHEDANALTIKGLKVGKYTLHIEKQAFKKSGFKVKEQNIPFEVVEEISNIESNKELKAYFNNILNQENAPERRRLFDFSMGVTQESQTMNDTASSEKAVGSTHSSTNNQVEGIEEGDTSVTNGRYIFSVVDQKVKIVDVQNPKKLAAISPINFNSNQYPMQLILHNQLLLVAFDEYIERTEKNGSYNGKNATKVAIYDMTNVEQPKLVRIVGQDGNKVGVRKTNDILYIVSNYTPNYYLMREFPQDDLELRPAVYDETVSISSEEMPLDTDKISILPSSNEPNYIVISALDLKNLQQGEIQTESYLGGSSTIYMSENAIYVTAPKYTEQPLLRSGEVRLDIAWSGRASDTDIYRFAIKGQEVKLSGQTSIPGSVLNQFSMDEHDGYFRIATTEGSASGADANSNNSLYIFDTSMNQTGVLTNLARGERIYSARFMGDKAYIVTFKETDPLFVIDLANPAKPTVLGELKIPGFSNYLHPIDDTHLLGFGYDTAVEKDTFSKEPRVVTKGMKLSLFDVSDLANPKEQDTAIIGGVGTYSDAQSDHKAFFRHAEKGLYGFPVVMYEGGKDYEVLFQGAGALIYNVTVKDGIQLVGDLVEKANGNEQYENWETVPQRILYVDDTLYTVGRQEVRSYDLNTFKEKGRLSY